MLRSLLIVATPSLYSHTWKSHRHSHTWMSHQFPALPHSYATRLIHTCYDSCIRDMPLIQMRLVMVCGTFASCPIWMRRRFPALLQWRLPPGTGWQLHTADISHTFDLSSLPVWHESLSMCVVCAVWSSVCVWYQRYAWHESLSMCVVCAVWSRLCVWYQHLILLISHTYTTSYCTYHTHRQTLMRVCRCVLCV